MARVGRLTPDLCCSPNGRGNLCSRRVITMPIAVRSLKWPAYRFCCPPTLPLRLILRSLRDAPTIVLLFSLSLLVFLAVNPIFSLYADYYGGS